MVGLLLQRLEDRGHLHRVLAPLFDQALTKVVTLKLPDPRPGVNRKNQKLLATSNDTLFVHLPYHPNNPTKPELKNIINDFKKDIQHFGFPLERVIIAHSRAPSLGSLCKKHRLEGYVQTNGDS